MPPGPSSRPWGRGTLRHGLSAPGDGDLPPGGDGVQKPPHPQGLPPEVEQDQRKQKFSIFAQKTIARHGAVWYNEAEDSGGMAVGSVIVITSGKGGTGKTSLTGGVGASLALLGKASAVLGR